MSLLERAFAAKSTRVSVSEDGRYAVGPTSEDIQQHLSMVWSKTYGGIEGAYALNMITVYQCVRVLSHTFAQLPLMLYRRRADGGKERATDHPWYRALHLQPNPGLTSFAYKRLLMTHLATWGDHFAEIVTDGLGEPMLFPIRPDRVEVYRSPSGQKVYEYLDPNGGRKEFRPGTVFHVTALSTDGLRGRSPISDLRSTIGLARTAERFGESFFRNNARPGIVMKHPKTLTTPAIQRLGAQMDELRGSGNAGRTVILEEGLDFSEVGIPPEDAQFMETRLYQKREIAGAFGIPPHLIGDLERATFSNIEQQSLELITVTMMPHLVNFEQEASVQLLDDDDVFAEFLVDGYLRGDAKSRNEAYAIRWQHGTLSANEWRIKENDNPVENGDTYWAPVNYAPIVDPEEQPTSTPPPVAETPPPDDQTDEEPAEDDAVATPAAKSAAVRCPACDKLLAEELTAPYRIGCPRCKQVVAA